MGLDQYAGIRFKTDDDKDSMTDAFYWRKHSKLQEFMEQLWTQKTGAPAGDLNCAPLILEVADIEALETALTTDAMPASEGGFFYGHQCQDENAKHYKEQDLAFCAWAKEQIAEGETIIYSCWW